MSPFREFPITKIFPLLQEDNLLPAIIFRSARRQCDQDLQAISQTKKGQLSSEAQQKIEDDINAAVLKHQLPEEVIRTHPQLSALRMTGVGAHHAGQLLPWRLLLEELMSRGALRLMLATGTVAAGVDFPARSVVITAHSRRDQEGFRQLTAAELQQMSGRAGRRGKDFVGFCLVAPGQYSDARVIQQVSHLPPEPLRSAYFAAPSTVLNLLKYRNVDDLRYTVSRSLASFVDARRALQLEAEVEEEKGTLDAHHGEGRKKLEKRLRRKLSEADAVRSRQGWLLEQTLAGLTDLGFLEGSSLSKKGSWAAELCTSLVLELAEAIEAGLLTEQPMSVFIGIVASLAGDPHRHYLSIKKSPVPKPIVQSLEKIVERVRNSYQNPNGTEIVVQNDAAATVVAWTESENWQEFSGLLRLAGVADGDVSRLVTQTADHLNQMTKLNVSHPTIAQQAFEARMMLMKPPFTDPEL